jgi:hypothetical protein
MNEMIYLVIIPIVLFAFHYLIKPNIPKYTESRLTINLMEMALTITLILIGIISAVSSGIIPVASFYIALTVLVIGFGCYGIMHRNEVIQKMRRAYFNALILYSYVFVTSGVIMFWALPFMPNVIL